MTTEEFSNAFDTLLSAHLHSAAFGNQSSAADINFDEFEKSQFLTNAQDKVVTELYSGTLADGFESTERIRRYLDKLVKYKEITLSDQGSASYLPQKNLYYYQVDLTSQASNLLFITYEAVSFNDTSLSCGSTKTVQVTPVRQDELAKIVKNPFRGPSTSRVLRVDAGYRLVELVSKYALGTYYLGYLEKPSPIILVSLPDNLTIEGKSSAQTCQLDSSLHRIILEVAVQLAVASRVTSSTK